MKILLDNDNASIANVVNICCERINAEVLPYSNDIDEYDLIIKNYDDGCDISEFDKTKTLFLVPKNLIGNFSSNLSLPKPFLPIDLINFLTNFGSFVSNSNSDETQNLDNTFSEAMGEKIAQDIQTISQIVKEIDDMPTQNQEKIKTGGVIMPSGSENIDNVIDILDDDRPLDEILKELSQKSENSQTTNIAETKVETQTAQTSENLAVPVISLNENFDMDDDIPLDQFIQNMQNEKSEKNENVANPENSSNPQGNDNKITIDENFDMDDDIPLDQFIQNMQNEKSENSANNDEFNQILNSINKSDFADDKTETAQDLASDETTTSQDDEKSQEEKLQKEQNQEEVAPLKSQNDENLGDDENQMSDIEEPKKGELDLAENDAQKLENIEQIDEADDDLVPLEFGDDIDLAPLNLAEQDDTDFFDDDELPPLELPSDDDFTPLNLIDEAKDETLDDDRLSQTEASNDDDFAPINLISEPKNDSFNDEIAPIELLSSTSSEKELAYQLQNDNISKISSDEVIALKMPNDENLNNQNLAQAQSQDDKKEALEKPQKQDFSDLKLVEVGKFSDDDLQTKSDKVNLQEKDETNQTENSNETQIDENLQENQSEKEQILAQNDEEMSIDELKEKLEETFKKAFEMSVASDEKLARALRNLKLDLNIAFKDK
ncbi:MAG: hypothetical protein IJR18_00690 [Campylobacter sp.]|nr:hypothetical protein [Campylobacter sp.]